MFNLEFFDKDKNRINVDGNLSFELQRIKRKANGGNDQLFFDIIGDDISLDAFLQTMLGKLVKVYDPNLIDEGFFSIETIDRFKDGVNYRRTLSEMFNKLAVQYEVDGMAYETSFVTDSASQETYGIRTKVVSVGEMTQVNAEKKRDLLFEEYRFPTQTTTVVPSNNQSKISVICSGLFSKMAYTFLDTDYTGTTIGAKASSYGASSTQRVTFANMSNSNDINDNNTYIKIKNVDTYKIAKSLVVPIHIDFYNQTTLSVYNELGDYYNYKVSFPVFKSDFIVRFRRDNNGVPGEIVATSTAARYDKSPLGNTNTNPTSYTDGGGTHNLYRPTGALDKMDWYKNYEGYTQNGSWNQEVTITLPDMLIGTNEYFWIEAEPIEIEIWEYWYFSFGAVTFDYVKYIDTKKRAILRYIQSSSYDKDAYGEGWTVKDGTYSVIENTATGTYFKPQFLLNYVYDLETLIKTVVDKTGIFSHTYIDPNVIAGNVEVSGLYLAGKSASTVLEELFTLGTDDKDSILQIIAPDGDFVVTTPDRLSIDNNFYLLIDKNNKLYNIDGSEYRRICPVGFWARLNVLNQMQENLATGDNKYFFVTASEYNFKNNTFTYSSESLQKGTVSDAIKTTSGSTGGGTGTGSGDMLKSTYDTDNDGKVDSAETADSVAWANVQSKPSAVTNLTQTVIDNSHESSKIGSKTLDETGISNDKFIFYNATSGKYELKTPSGSGDMAKSTYDTNNNGKVDVAELAESVAWANVSSKPTPVTNLTQGVIDNSHAHSNKAVLDNIVQGLIDDRHTHSNKSVLDNLTQGVIDNSHPLFASETHAATVKNPPVDADEMAIVDTENANVIKKVTMTILKAFLKTYFDTVYNWYIWANDVHAASSKTQFVDADEIGLADSASSFAIKKMTYASLRDNHIFGGTFNPKLTNLSTKIRFPLTGGLTNDALGAASFSGMTDKVLYIPFVPARTLTLDRIGLWVTTAVAGKKIRLGIYSSSNNLPYQKLAESGDLNQGSTVFQESTISQELKAGVLYYAAVVSNNTALACKRLLKRDVNNFLGIDYDAGSDYYTMVTQTLSSGWTELPSTAGTVTGIMSGIDIPLIYARPTT